MIAVEIEIMAAVQIKRSPSHAAGQASNQAQQATIYGEDDHYTCHSECISRPGMELRWMQ